MKIKNCLFGIIMAIVLSGCYNDDKLWNALDEQEQRIEALESWQKVMNSNIEALQSLVDGQDYITKVTPVTLNGEVVGYTITFKSQSPITIYNGEKGDKGDKGDQGITTDVPVISVIREKDGNWYWTLNGELLKDADGNSIRANGQDGKDGQDGKPGEDGKPGQDGSSGQDGAPGQNAPKPELNTGKELMDEGLAKDLIPDAIYLSVDNKKSWTKVSGNDGNDGNDGDTMFTEVDIKTSTDYVIFHLADGSQIKVHT